MSNHKLWDATDKGTVTYSWEPLPDITAYELALCMPILSSKIDSGSTGHPVDKLPTAAKRHFVRVG